MKTFTLRKQLFLVLTLIFIGASAHADFLAMTGPELYGRFCASCHGASGHGDGPVSHSFTIEVPDLTLITRRHGGKFPRERIEKIIDGRFMLAAHGTRTMPVWGEGLSLSEIGNPDAERATQTIIGRLVDFVRQLQKPARETKLDVSSKTN